MEQFQKNKSLCPMDFYGVPITPFSYEMKSSLYHFLAQMTIVSIDNHDVCNIINKYALTTDGYQALYDIMA